MDHKGYLNQRLELKITWYERQSLRHQSLYRSLRLIELVCAALIPFGAGLIHDYGFLAQASVAALSVLIIASCGVMSLSKLHERALQYTSAAEALKQHKYLYLTQTPPYHQVDAFPRLVAVAEAIMAKESTRWLVYSPPKPSR